MRRRNLATTIGGMFALPLAALAQQHGKVRRIGLLSNNPWTDQYALGFWAEFRSELERFGWKEGRDVVFELASSDGVFERLPAVARELVGRGVGLIVVAGGLAALAVRDATRTIPVVFVGAADPLGTGLVDSLARPGGNLTGLANLSFELIPKRLQLLVEVANGARRIAYLTTKTGGAAFDEEAARVAAALGLQWSPVKVSDEGELAATITEKIDVDAWYVGDPILTLAREKVVSAFAALRKPVIYPNSGYVRLGGLLSYGANAYAISRRAAWFTDRILRGTKPADLPVEQPAVLELQVNLRTAQAQGITIPQSVLHRADEVID